MSVVVSAFVNLIGAGMKGREQVWQIPFLQKHQFSWMLAELNVCGLNA